MKTSPASPLLLLALALLAVPASGQSIIAAVPAPRPALFPPADRPPEEEPEAAPPSPRAWRSRLAYEHVEVRDLPIRPGELRGTRVERATASLGLALGRQWLAGAAAERTVFSDDAFRDTTAWSVSLGGTVRAAPGTFDLAHASGVTELPLAETSRQTRERTHRTGVAARLPLDSAIALEAGAAQHLRFAADAPSVREWPLFAAVVWRPSAEFEVGPFVSFVPARIEPGPDLTALTPQLALRWAPRETVALRARAGPGYRRFHGGGDARFERFVATGDAEWRPRAHSRLRLFREDDVAVSYFAAVVTLRTTEGVAWHQRLNPTLTLEVSGERQRQRYVAPAPGGVLATDRTDWSRRSSVCLLWAVRRGLVLSFEVKRLRNRSTLPSYTFVTDLWSVGLARRF